MKNLVSKKFMPLFQVWLDYLDLLEYKNYYKVLISTDYEFIPKEVSITFPKTQMLFTRLSELLVTDVDSKHYLSTKVET